MRVVNSLNKYFFVLFCFLWCFLLLFYNVLISWGQLLTIKTKLITCSFGLQFYLQSIDFSKSISLKSKLNADWKVIHLDQNFKTNETIPVVSKPFLSFFVTPWGLGRSFSSRRGLNRWLWISILTKRLAMLAFIDIS